MNYFVFFLLFIVLLMFNFVPDLKTITIVMKKIKVLVIGMMLSMTIPNFSQSCNDASLLEPLALSCQIIDESKSDKEALFL